MVSAEGIKCASGSGLLLPLEELVEDEELVVEVVELEEDEELEVDVVELEEDVEELEVDDDELEEVAPTLFPPQALTNTTVAHNNKNLFNGLFNELFNQPTESTPTRVNFFSFLKCSIRFPYKILLTWHQNTSS
jgi:hypothetical protein